MKILIVTSAPAYMDGKYKDYSESLGNTVTIFNLSPKNNINKQNKPDWGQVLKTDADVVVFFQLYRYLKSAQKVIAFLKNRGVKVFDNGLSANGYVTNKVEDLKKLSDCNFAIPFYTTYDSELDCSYNLLKNKLKSPFIAKIPNASKGKGVFKISDQSQYLSLLDFAKKADGVLHNLVFQQFIDYKHDLRVLVVGDKMYCMERIPQNGEFRANFSLGGTVRPFKLTSSITNLANNAINCTNLKISGVDVLIDKNGKEYILEVNHNPGFSGMEEALKTSIAPQFHKTILS